MQTRNIRCLPDVLVINCEVNSAKEAEFWKVQAEVNVTASATANDNNPLPPPKTVWSSLCRLSSQYAFNKAVQKEKMEPAKPKDPPPMPTEWCLE